MRLPLILAATLLASPVLASGPSYVPDDPHVIAPECRILFRLLPCDDRSARPTPRDERDPTTPSPPNGTPPRDDPRTPTTPEKPDPKPDPKGNPNPCDDCDDFRDKYNERPWEDNPKWSPDHRHPNAKPGNGAWEICHPTRGSKAKGKAKSPRK